MSTNQTDNIHRIHRRTRGNANLTDVENTAIASAFTAYLNPTAKLSEKLRACWWLARIAIVRAADEVLERGTKR